MARMDGKDCGLDAFASAEVCLTDEEFAAVEGWRRANSYSNRAEALRALVRLGLLSEIGRVYRAATHSPDQGGASQA